MLKNIVIHLMQHDSNGMIYFKTICMYILANRIKVSSKKQTKMILVFDIVEYNVSLFKISSSTL